MIMRMVSVRASHPAAVWAWRIASPRHRSPAVAVAAGVLAILLAIVADALLAIVQRAATPWVRARRAV